MSKKLNFTKTGEKKIGNRTQKTIQVTRTDKKNVDMKLVQKIFDKMNKRYDKFIIRGGGNIGWRDLKGLNDNDLKDNLDNYIDDRVANSSKFKEFDLIQIVVLE